MVCEATHSYKGQYEDELSFSMGQKVEITADSEWNQQFLIVTGWLV